MNHDDLFNTLRKNGDPERAAQMRAYMRDQFAYLGVPAKKRQELCKEFYKGAKKEKTVDWGFVSDCWREPAREFQYIAADYLVVVQDCLTPDDIPKIRDLAIEKSWWDSVDGLDSVVGHIAFRYPEVNATILEWSLDENIWLRRIAIDHQLKRKEKTDTEFFEKILVNNFGTTEFFINKAIGWSLREYSKSNPEWVRDFVSRYEDRLAPLSKKEASKYL